MANVQPFLPHQQRVVDEKRELDDKIYLLTRFIVSQTFSLTDPVEQVRLRQQLVAMNAYSDILGERIQWFLETQSAQ